MINGIKGYNNLYGYQSTINQTRLNNILKNRYSGSAAISPVPAIPSYKQPNESLSDSIDYLKKYSTSMTDLMSSANSLRSGNTGSVFNQPEAITTDSAILDASKNGRLTSGDSYDVNIEQLAKSQANISDAFSSSARASSDLNMQLSAGGKTVDVQISSTDSNGIKKTNSQMLSEAAASINKAGAGVKASVVTEDAKSSLKLESVKTGASNSFHVSGDFAKEGGMANTIQNAQNASYSVTENGTTKTYSSESNQVSLDYGTISMTLKKEGSASVNVGNDPEKIASAMSDLVESYNDTVKLLTENKDRGSGNSRQLSSLESLTGSNETMDRLGMSFNKDGTLSLDKEKLTDSLTKEPSLAKDLISGPSGFAQKAFNAGKSGSTASAGSIVGNDVAQHNYEQAIDTANMMNSFSRRGAYNMMNYNAVGLLLNMYV